MTDKTLRILIADTRHFHRMKIERLFNGLDYYRIAPVQNLTELLTLVDYGCQPFDVLVLNAELAAGMSDLCGYLFDHPQVRHVLVYGEAKNAPADSAQYRDRITISHVPLPSMGAIAQLMASVEACREHASRMAPATSFAQLRV
ncbi:chemotaxis protein CheY [Pseudomonas sp. KCJK9016]|uniref:chemotaxis protein CheY n=1 Tax=Pseudomonas sp. KCJK9016 TaxID=3344556 RepID=UPI003906BBBB